MFLFSTLCVWLCDLFLRDTVTFTTLNQVILSQVLNKSELSWTDFMLEFIVGTVCVGCDFTNQIIFTRMPSPACRSHADFGFKPKRFLRNNKWCPSSVGGHVPNSMRACEGSDIYFTQHEPNISESRGRRTEESRWIRSMWEHSGLFQLGAWQRWCCYREMITDLVVGCNGKRIYSYRSAWFLS